MANEDSKAKATDAQKAPRSQTRGDTPQPQVATSAGPELTFAGDNEAIVNPALPSNSATLPTGEDENGVMQGDTFYKGEVYHVNDDALEVKNTEEVNFLIKNS